jgi:hypothetical protein
MFIHTKIQQLEMCDDSSDVAVSVLWLAHKNQLVLTKVPLASSLYIRNRKREKRNTYKILVGKYEGKRPLERQE